MKTSRAIAPILEELYGNRILIYTNQQTLDIVYNQFMYKYRTELCTFSRAQNGFYGQVSYLGSDVRSDRQPRPSSNRALHWSHIAHIFNSRRDTCKIYISHQRRVIIVKV